MSIHHNKEAIQDVAQHYADQHGVQYTVILRNPDKKGEFSHANGSTYEFVTDSYFAKERPSHTIISRHNRKI